MYHFSAKVISRKAGRSATASAAYRAGEKISDERTGLLHDYTKKNDVLATKIFMPGGQNIDRAELWNAVEKKHKRGDAVVAREFEIALPHQLNNSQREALAFEYAKSVAERYGVAADACIHAPAKVTEKMLEHDPTRFYIKEADGTMHNGNWHLHLLLSACYVNKEGELGKKCVELDPIHMQRVNSRRKKEGKEPVPNSVENEREIWEQLCNEHLKKAKINHRVDHRSLAAQGIDRAPTKHKGPSVSAIVARGDISYVAQAQAAEQAHEQQIIDAQNIDIAAINEELRMLSNAQVEAEKVLAKAREHAKTKLQQKREQQKVVSHATPPNPPLGGGNLAKPARERANVIRELNEQINKLEKRLKLVVQAGLPQHLLAKNETLVQLKAAQNDINKRIYKIHAERNATNKKLGAWRKKHKLLAFLRIKTGSYKALLAEVKQQDVAYKRLASDWQCNSEAIKNEERIAATAYANRLQHNVSKLKVRLKAELKAQADEQKAKVEQRQKQLSKQRARTSAHTDARREKTRF